MTATEMRLMATLDPLMLALGIMLGGKSLDYHPDVGHLAVHTHGGGIYRVEFEQLDALVERGLVALDGDRCEVTGRGYYQWQRWSKANNVRVRT